MKTSALFFLVVWFLTKTSVNGYQLPPFGEVCNPGKEWRLCEEQTDAKSEMGWSWLALTNTTNGDVLAFAARRLDKEEP